MKKVAQGEERMRAWIKANKDNESVLEWIEDNPPSEDWQGTKLEWAFTEMPVGLFTRRPGKFF